MIVTHNGIDFEVEYHAYAGSPGSREEPPEPPEFWLTSIKIEGNELIEMISDETLAVLEKMTVDLVWKNRNEDDEYLGAYGDDY